MEVVRAAQEDTSCHSVELKKVPLFSTIIIKFMWCVITIGVCNNFLTLDSFDFANNNKTLIWVGP